MKIIGFFVYLVSTNVYFALIYLLSPFKSRAKQMLDGRNKILSERIQISGNKKIAWFHCASLGEFEQGKPLMLMLKQKNYNVAVSFFSPSGYLQKQNDEAVDYAFYLPFDGYFNALKTINNINPSLVFWIRYDFWFFFLYHLKQKKIPVYLVSSLFRPEQLFFKWYGSFYKNILKMFDYIFCQTETSVKLVQTINKNVLLTGDTRFDNVIERSNSSVSNSAIAFFCNSADFVVIAGSSYAKEELLLQEALYYFKGKIKLIIAPHFVNEQRILEIENTFKDFKYQVLSKTNLPEPTTEVLIIDSIGKLAGAYKNATLAFVGGGFKKGDLHNILEPAVFGLPICFGFEVDRFPEAQAMLELKVAATIKNKLDLIGFINDYLSNREKLHQTQNILKQYVLNQSGASKKIIATIQNL